MSADSFGQTSLFDPEIDRARTLLSDLIDQSSLYRTSDDFMRLLDFVVQLGNMAPFNAMLLQVQKPGLRFAATAYDWRAKFGRSIKEGARPLLIMWPFSPVALVYDVDDTAGPPLPSSVVEAFRATGPVRRDEIDALQASIYGLGIDVRLIEYGSGLAGNVRVAARASSQDRQGETVVGYRAMAKKERSHYEIRLNATHSANVQFATLTHELAHLFLGHLGPDPFLSIPQRAGLSHALCELEAEAVSYLVCRRRGVDSYAEVYLSNYVNRHTTVDNIDIYSLTRAAGRIETALGIAPKIEFDTPKQPVRRR